MRERISRVAEAMVSPVSLHEVAFRSRASHRQAMRHLRASGWRLVKKAEGQVGLSSLWVKSE